MAHSTFIFASYAASRLTCRLLYLVHVQSTSLGSALLGSVPACLNFLSVLRSKCYFHHCYLYHSLPAKPDFAPYMGGIGQKKKGPLAVLLIDFPFLSRLRFYPGPVFVQPRNWKLESQDPRRRPHCSLAKRLLR